MRWRVPAWLRLYRALEGAGSRGRSRAQSRAQRSSRSRRPGIGRAPGIDAVPATAGPAAANRPIAMRLRLGLRLLASSLPAAAEAEGHGGVTRPGTLAWPR